MSFTTTYTILFHGNCLDGWFAAYISYTFLKNGANVKMFPISPNQRNTWPNMKEMIGTGVLLVDVSIEKSVRDEWMSKGVLSIDCIDHHASAIAHWPLYSNGASTIIDTTKCAALQAWKRFFPLQIVPDWLERIDRIDRWDNPSYQDRCLREVLSIISHLPVEKKLDEAIKQTEEFFKMYQDTAQMAELLNIGKQILDKKDAELFQILQAGTTVQITPQHIVEWGLPNTWFGANVFIIDNSFQPFDTTEAAYIIFQHMPQVHIFVNYRRKGFHDKVSKTEKSMVVYSARSRAFDITQGTVLKGHPTSAGASLIVGEAPTFPFVSPVVVAA